VLICLLIATVSRADTLTVTLGDLQSALDNSADEPDAVRRMILQQIQSRLNDADIQLEQGQLIFEQSLFDTTVEDGCNRTIVKHMHTQLILNQDSSIALTLRSLHEPMVVALDLSATLNSSGRARQIVGFRFDNCVDLARDTFDFSARGPIAVSIGLTLRLNPEFITPTQLRLTPTIAITSRVTDWDIRVDVDDSVLRNLIERLLQSELEKEFGPESLNAELSQLQNLADDLLVDAAPDGVIDIELPEPNDDQIIALYRLLMEDARFPLTLEHVRRYRHELLAALILRDETAFRDIVGNALACQATDILKIPLERQDVFVNTESGCTIADDTILTPATLLESTDRFIDVYADESCKTHIPFVSTSANDYCETALSAERLGNAAHNQAALDHWTLSPASRFDIGSLSITGKQQPYLQKVNYKTVQTTRGECHLEMRIYSAHPTTTGTTPVLALHGGSWQYRGSGFLGIEFTATQFVHSGFTVFAPFYRLIGDNDGNAECNNATMADLLEDTNDALNWLQNNSEQFGAQGKPIVFGQSAGGHLAASLAVNRADEVDRGIFLYAPTDFNDFASRLQQGIDSSDRGLKILEVITGQSIEDVDINSTVIQENTFPSRIAAQPQAYPPVFLIHGQADDLLPFRQSTRLCNAMSGNPDVGPASFEPVAEGAWVRESTCDTRGSELHLLREGEHALDLCIAPELCFAGSPEGRRAAEQVLQRMFRWAQAKSLPLIDSQEINNVQNDDPIENASNTPTVSQSLTVQDNSGGGSGGASSLWSLIFLLVLRRCRAETRQSISRRLSAFVLLKPNNFKGV